MATKPKRNMKPAKAPSAHVAGLWDRALEGDPRFLARIKRARQSLRAGKGTKDDYSRQHPPLSAERARLLAAISPAPRAG